MSCAMHADNIEDFWFPLYTAQPPLDDDAVLFLNKCLNATSKNPSGRVVEPFGPQPIELGLRELKGHKHADVVVNFHGMGLVIEKVGA